MSRRAVLWVWALWASAAGPAWAVDAVTGASRRVHSAGTPNAAIWITGRGFQNGLTVLISGAGITPAERPPEVVPQASRFDGGLGDGIAYYFSIAPDAPSGSRSITVTNPDGTSATGADLIEIMGGAAPPPADGGVPPPPPPQEPPAQPGAVDVVSRASPRFAAQGEQVNLWITGRVFNPGAQVTFSVGQLGPAVVDGAPLEAEVVRNAESENGELDGIQYFLQIPAMVPPGKVDITVTNPDGSSARGPGLFEVVAPGQQPTPAPGEGQIDAITGASPRAVRSGNNVSLWIWGEGFDLGAEVAFSNPGARAYAKPEVVVRSTSHPGFSGVRNFLLIDEAAAPGPVDVTITNRNGSTRTVAGLLDLVGGEGGAVGNGADGVCPDLTTVVEALADVQPARLARGETARLMIEGRGFACGSSVVIPGGGLTPENTPELVRDAEDAIATRLFWTLTVADDAELGARDVTVVNPNSSAKTLIAAFEVVEGEGTRSGDGVAFCSAGPETGGLPGWCWALVVAFAWRRRRG